MFCIYKVLQDYQAAKTSKTILYSIFYYLHVVFLKFGGYFRVLLSAKRISLFEVVDKWSYVSFYKNHLMVNLVWRKLIHIVLFALVYLISFTNNLLDYMGLNLSSLYCLKNQVPLKKQDNWVSNQKRNFVLFCFSLKTLR